MGLFPLGSILSVVISLISGFFMLFLDFWDVVLFPCHFLMNAYCALVFLSVVAFATGTVLTRDNFHQEVQQGAQEAYFIKFYAPWCGYCQQLQPIWKGLENQLAKDPSVRIGEVNCDEQFGLCKLFDIPGFPILKLVTKEKVYRYRGKRDIESLRAFASGGYQNAEGTPAPPEGCTIPADSSLEDLYKVMEIILSDYLMPALGVVGALLMFVGGCCGLVLQRYLRRPSVVAKPKNE